MKLIYDIVGCGAVLQQYHVPIILHLIKKHNVRIRGCFDLNVANAKKVASMLHASVVGDPSNIGDFEAVNAALIATPPDSHAELIDKYVSEGKPVFVEKPFVTTTDDAERLVYKAKLKGARILVGNLRRFYPSVMIAKSIVASGVLGNIHTVEATEGRRWEWAVLSKYVVENPFGGVIYDMGSHLIDMVLFILSLDQDKIDYRIEQLKKKPANEPSHECSATVILSGNTIRNQSLHLHLSRLERLAWIIKFYGERGTLLVPADFSLFPTLECENSTKILEPFLGLQAATDEAGCFLLEHMELLNLLKGRLVEDSVLDGRNFVALISLLESLTNSRE